MPMQSTISGDYNNHRRWTGCWGLLKYRGVCSSTEAAGVGGRRGECSNGTAGTQRGAAETGESTGEYVETETESLCSQVLKM